MMPDRKCLDCRHDAWQHDHNSGRHCHVGECSCPKTESRVMAELLIAAEQRLAAVEDALRLIEPKTQTILRRAFGMSEGSTHGG